MLLQICGMGGEDYNNHGKIGTLYIDRFIFLEGAKFSQSFFLSGRMKVLALSRACVYVCLSQNPQKTGNPLKLDTQ